MADRSSALYAARGARSNALYTNTPNVSEDQRNIELNNQTDGSFGQGIQRGVRGLRAGFGNALGTANEVLGNTDAATKNYAEAQHQNELGAALSPDIPQLRDVHDIASGARYIAGQAGAGLSYVAPAVLSTTGARLLGAGTEGAAAAGMAANTAPMTGNVQERLRADPVTAKLSPLRRAAIATGEGLTDAAMYEVPASLAAGRAVGAMAPAVKPSLNVIGNIAKETAGQAAGMGAAGVATTALGHGVQSELNPNRDTSNDTQDLIDSGVGGTVGMIPLAIPHAVAAHTVGAGVQAVPKVGDALKSGIGGTGEAVNGAKSWVENRMARTKDADYNTLHSKQVAPPGADDAWMAQDDARRNEAAGNVARRYLADPNASDKLKSAADEYLKGPQTDTSWQDLQGANQVATSVAAVKDGLTNLAGMTQSGLTALKDGLEHRENAQNINSLADGSFDSLLADKLFKHTGLQSSDEILHILPATVHSVKDWVSNGFALKAGGEVTVPRGLSAAFKDPVNAVTDAYDLMRKQGLVKDDPAKLKEVIGEIQNHIEAKKSDGSIVEDNLLPTAQSEHNFSGVDHVQIASEVKGMIASGKMNETVLDSLFGANKERALEALSKNMKLDKHEYQHEHTSEADGDVEGELGQNPNEVAPDVQWHGPYDVRKAGAANGLRTKLDELRTTGRAAKDVGIVDHLRELHGHVPEEFIGRVSDLVDAHKHTLTMEEGSRPDEALNKHLRVARSEDMGDKHEAIDIPASEFDTLTTGSGNNKWAMSAGDKGQYGTAAHGRLWFERPNSHGVIDKSTGEVKPTLFNTSASRIISRMRGATKEIGGHEGVLNQHDMLMQGISSLLNSTALSGRVGFKETADGPIKWLGRGDRLPKEFMLSSSSSMEHVARAVAANASKVGELKDWMKKNEHATWTKDDAKELAAAKDRQAAGAKNESVVRELNTAKERFEHAQEAKQVLESRSSARVSEFIDKVREEFDGETGNREVAESKETRIIGKATDEATGAQVHKTVTETVHQAEGEEMSDAANKAEDNKVRNFDETTGEPLHPKERLQTAEAKSRAAALAELVKPQTVKQSNEQTVFGKVDEKPLSAEEQTSIRNDVVKRLGGDIAVEFASKVLGSKGAEISGDWQHGLIRVSLKAQDPAGVASHEAMHEFFDRITKSEGAQKVKTILLNAANSAPVHRQIERLLDGHPEALAQIKEGSPHAAEERLAYMYQFWRAGLLKVGPETTTTFQKIANFFRSVVGKLSNDVKAEKLLQAFDDGKAPTADAAAKVLADNIEYREKLINSAYETVKPVVDKIAQFTQPSEAVLMKSGNPHLQEILRLNKNPTGEGVEQSRFEAQGQKMAQFMNAFQTLAVKFEPKDMELASKYLHEGTVPTDRVAKEIYDKVHELLSNMDKYVREAGVKRMDENGKWVDMGHIENYYPQVYDMAAMSKDTPGFIKDLLDNHGDILEGIAAKANAEVAADIKSPDWYASALAKDKSPAAPVTAEDIAQAITNRLLNASGSADLSESTSDLGFSPNMKAINQRSLDWLDKKAMSKWMNHDMVSVMTSYIAQGVKRAEYVRRFENGGKGLTSRMDDAFKFEVDKELAKGSTQDEADTKALKNLEGPSKAIMALEGTLGYDITPTMRRLQGTLMAYENIRTMGLSLFSALIDPLGLLVRGGEMKDATAAYSRSLKEVWSTWKGEHTTDSDAQLAEMLGTVDAGGFLANFGQAYSALYLNQKVRKWNEALFKWNGMDGFNRGVRIQATQAAISFIKRQVTAPTEHSDRYLGELILTKKGVVIDKNGDLDYSNPKIQVAVKRWVDQSILRPNAAHRPTWMSDPHYAIFGHMKQFSYTFHDTIMKRAWMEAKAHGNMAPMAIMLGAFAPMMVASDLAKSIMLTGDTPTWAKEGLPSMIDHGVRRAGLLGLAQPYADPLMTGHPASMFGPTVEQAVSAMTHPFKETMVDALPLSSVINTMQGGNHVELMADD